MLSVAKPSSFRYPLVASALILFVLALTTSCSGKSATSDGLVTRTNAVCAKADTRIWANEALLQGNFSARTIQAIRSEVAAAGRPKQARALLAESFVYVAEGLDALQPGGDGPVVAEVKFIDAQRAALRRGVSSFGAPHGH